MWQWLRFRRAAHAFASGMCWGACTGTNSSRCYFRGAGKPAEAPGRFALATSLEFTEGFSDRQAADAVGARIDWKYALGLELADARSDDTAQMPCASLRKRPEDPPSFKRTLPE
jgi:hypothetical protein